MDNIDTLRGILFDTLRDLRDKENPMDIARAKAVCDVAGQITETAKVELQLMSITKERIESSFLPDCAGATLPEKKDQMLPAGVRLVPTGSPHVTRTVQELPGATITRNVAR